MTVQDDLGTLTYSGNNSNTQELPQGSSLGRYVIIESIGAGGMGTVYRAYDPQLNRGIALKILSVKRADLPTAERAKARLIREAQALAQLSHPNVVAVHDAGALDDDVFIAMELVEGKTLENWMRGEKRSIKEILEVMIAAGKGLSAAHKAGLIHRDFKPGNVIVGDDGRVRVLDFGLARAAEQEESIEDRPTESEQDGQNQETKIPFNLSEITSDSSPNLLQSPLTHVGGVLGTPLYMAPEQHLGAKIDERTDQFGFCVVLYEALYGRRPFEAKTVWELKNEVLSHKVCIPRADTDVPDWLWQIVHKGLSAKPEDRYSTIDLLLEELNKDPQEARRQRRFARRRRLYLISLIFLTVALPIGVWYGMRYRTFQLCKDVKGEFEGVWDVESKTSIQKAFLNTKKSFAQETWERVERIVDSYVDHWSQMRSEVCQARFVSSTQSEELFDLRMNCLRKRKGELGALLKVFVEADFGVVQKAVRASSSLTEITICANEEAMRAPYPPPKTIELKTKVEIIRNQLTEVEVLIKTGKHKDGLSLVQKLEVRAKKLDYLPVKAEVLYWLGLLYANNGKPKKAESTLYRAAQLAGKSKNLEFAAQASVDLVRIVGYEQARVEEGLALGRIAEVILDLGGGDEILRSRYLNYLGIIFWQEKEYGKAMEFYRKALPIRERILGPDHPDVAKLLLNLGNLFAEQFKFNQAMKFYRKTLTILETTLGEGHPEAARLYNNIGNVFKDQGESDKALEYYRKSLAIYQTALGIEHPDVSWPLHNIGGVYHDLGENNKALEFYHKALTIYQRSVGPEHPGLGETLIEIGHVFKSQGKYDRALEYYRRAQRIYQKSLGPKHPLMANALCSIGLVHWKCKRYKEAHESLSKALLICETAVAFTKSILVLSLTGIGNLFIEQRQPERSLKLLERAVRTCKEYNCKTEPQALALFGLAQALVSKDGNKVRAINLAKQAWDLFSKTPKRYKKELEEVNNWLQQHAAKKVPE